MPSLLTARELVDRVRKRTGDESISGVNTTWTDLEILEAIDEAMQEYHVLMRGALRDHEVDYETFTIADDFTEIDSYWRELRLPPYMANVRYVEGLVGSTSNPIDMAPVDYPQRNMPRWGRTGHPVWLVGGGGRPGTMSLLGNASFTQIRIFFYRRYPRLHYGTLASTGSSTTIVFPTDATGGLVTIDDTYKGMDVYNETTAELARITAYTASSRTATVSATSASWSSTSADTYSLLAPTEPEFNDYLTQLTANQLFRRAGNMDYLMMTAGYTQKLEENFKLGLRQRQMAAPKPLLNRRGWM